MSKLTKTERMNIRFAMGDRELQAPARPSRGPEYLVAHACFGCRKSWKQPDKSTAKCPQCGGALHWIGRSFKPPRKADTEQWAKVQALWEAGFRFPTNTGWHDEAEPFPDRFRDVDDFIKRNPKHPFRIAQDKPVC